MAWAERFICDVCGKLRGDTEAWWIAEIDCASATGNGPTPSVLKLMPWDNLMGHSADTRHLCGAGCVHTFLDRWMADVHAGTENCATASDSQLRVRLRSHQKKERRSQNFPASAVPI